MSTTPPPFSSGPGPYATPLSYDRQTLKAQRRAIAQQAVMQRAQLRAQMRAARRRSIVGPVMLVALGTVLLLLQTGRIHWPDALAWLGRWWPAVLIVAGLVMAGEWILDRGRVSETGVPLAPRRFLGGGAVFLLILLGVVGATVMAAENGSAWARSNLDQRIFQNGFEDWRQVFGVRSEFSEDLRAPISPDGSLTVNDAHGDVIVTGSSEDGQVHVTVHRHIYAWQQSDIDARRRTEQVAFSGDRAQLMLSAPTQDQDDADLSIEVPHGALLTIHSDHGDITLGELRGAVDVTARDGDVKLTALSGPVHLQTHDDDADISAHSLGAGLTLEGHAGDINLSDIVGPVALRGDFFGTTHLERIRGTVQFQSSFTQFACANLPGELNVEGRSDLNAHSIEGPVTLSTTNRNLTLEGLRGGATVTDRNGSVKIVLVSSLAPLHVVDEDGSVEVSLPRDEGFSIEAHTQNGDIRNDFGLTPEKNGQTAQLTGKLGSGGPALTLQTTEGDVNLRKNAPGDAVDWSDVSERITVAPVTANKRHQAKAAAPDPDE